jgi:hypothetical protein
MICARFISIWRDKAPSQPSPPYTASGAVRRPENRFFNAGGQAPPRLGQSLVLTKDGASISILGFRESKIRTDQREQRLTEILEQPNRALDELRHS